MSYIATKLVILVPILNSLGQVIKKWLFPDDPKRTLKLPKLRAVFLRLFPSKKRISILILSLAFMFSTIWGFVQSTYSGWRLVVDAVVYFGLLQGLLVGLSAMGAFDTVHAFRKTGKVLPHLPEGRVIRHDDGYVRTKLHRLSKKYGVPRKACHPHAFRALFARKVYEKMKDIRLVSNLLGHKSISTTTKYLRVSSRGMSRRISQMVDW